MLLEDNCNSYPGSAFKKLKASLMTHQVYLATARTWPNLIYQAYTDWLPAYLEGRSSTRMPPERRSFRQAVWPVNLVLCFTIKQFPTWDRCLWSYLLFGTSLFHFDWVYVFLLFSYKIRCECECWDAGVFVRKQRNIVIIGSIAVLSKWKPAPLKFLIWRLHVSCVDIRHEIPGRSTDILAQAILGTATVDWTVASSGCCP